MGAPAPALTDGTVSARFPGDVLRDPRLTDDAKAAALCQMLYDAAELAVATEEGMPGNDSELARRVLLALHELHRGIDVEHTGPTKQHACICRVAEHCKQRRA